MIDLEKLKSQVLVYDIECSSPYDISNEFEKYVENAKVKFIGFYSYAVNKYYVKRIPFNDEQIKEFISAHKCIVGFNNDEFDTPIMKNNKLWPKKYLYSIDLKPVLTQKRGYLMGFSFKKDSLRECAKTMKVETQKGDINYEIFEKDNWTPDELVEIEKYLESDVMATKQMFDKVFDFWKTVIHFVDEKNVYNWSFITCSEGPLAYKYACHVTGAEEEYDEKGEETDGGGRVIEPKVEEAWNVVYVDVRSMYPHNYAQANLFAEVPTFTPGSWHGNDVIKVRGYYDISAPHPLCKDMMEKMKERIRLKKENPKDPMVYAYKILLNSTYGANRSKVFKNLYTENSGYDCCWIGQQINHIIEDKLKEFGYEPIYGDTDSIMAINVNNKSYQELREHLNIIVQYIKDNMPFPQPTFDIEIEAFIDYIMFVNGDNKDKKLKKNYCYIKSKKDGTKELTVMGLPIKKANATELGPLVFEKYIAPRMLKEIKGKFEKQWILDLINAELKDNLHLMAQEYNASRFDSYSLAGNKCLYAQISKNYLNGKAGKIKLIKNKFIGKVGGTWKYCTLEEGKNLTMDKLDLTKVLNELQPFCREKLDGSTIKAPVKGFFNCGELPEMDLKINQLSLKKGFF